CGVCQLTPSGASPLELGKVQLHSNPDAWEGSGEIKYSPWNKKLNCRGQVSELRWIQRKTTKAEKGLTNIGCWNVQVLNTKEQQVFRELMTYNIDIAVLSETKKRDRVIKK
ncbi:hypothetical protein HHI36_007143, partial [Cryptolaemus montrouzieri]